MLADLIARLEAARGPDAELGLRLAVLDQGTVVKIEGPHRGDDGGDEYAATVDERGGARKKVYINERELPDRSIDAALALVERKLPGFTSIILTGDPTLRPSNPEFRPSCRLKGHLHCDEAWARGAQEPASAPTAPLAICLALLRALVAPNAGGVE